MKHFLAVLEETRASPAPALELVHLAARLCHELQNGPPLGLEPLAEAVLGSPHWQYFLARMDVVRACVLVLTCRGQHQAACRLLEHCREAGEREQLIQLWNEIHYRKLMEKCHVDSLTPVQKFRCRKRNPPPPSLCPEGVKSRNFSKDVRQRLLAFAAGVTMNPNREQRGRLALETGLQAHQIYNWFANYRRRQRSSLQRQGGCQALPPGRESAPEAQAWLDPGPCNLQAQAGFQGDVHLGPPEAPLGPCELAWEPPMLGLRCPPEEGLTKLLDARFVRSNEMPVEKLGQDPRTLLLTSGPSYPLEGPSNAICPPASAARPGPVIPALAPWPDNFLLGPCEPLPGQVQEAAYGQALELLPPVPGMSHEPASTGALSPGPLSAFWDPRSSGFQAPAGRIAPRVGMDPRPEVVLGQPGLEVGSFMLREQQLRPLECVLPQSSSEMGMEKPPSPRQISSLDEPRDMEYGQNSSFPRRLRADPPSPLREAPPEEGGDVARFSPPRSTWPLRGAPAQPWRIWM
ncbi:anomalous homeobox protein isoform X2 [Monodelphis domestica]|uniref:anomalous homeobox protein isoform X2 n=1 Tax=Monodelphis domestica TaxID=13616 RepID=UPI0024E1B02C|nr:anomalous homeobox protein isoform X2 [Monodelphis domestica]